MPIARTHRVPVLLLSLLVGTLLVPRACDSTRVAVGAWLPGSVRADTAPPPQLDKEERGRLQHRVALLEQQLAARPAGDGTISGVRVVQRRSAATLNAVPARVLHRETSSARRTLVIDAGRDDGIGAGLPVIQGDSLIGVVTTCSGRAARVVRVDDRGTETSLPAVILAAEPDAPSPYRGDGVARGTGDGRIRVSFLASGAARVGDIVVTGAGSGLVPEGYVLGEVVEVTDEDRDGSIEAIVKPLRDLDAVASVLVLRVEPLGLRVDAK